MPTEVELNRSLMLVVRMCSTMYIYALCAHARLRRGAPLNGSPRLLTLRTPRALARRYASSRRAQGNAPRSLPPGGRPPRLPPGGRGESRAAPSCVPAPAGRARAELAPRAAGSPFWACRATAASLRSGRPECAANDERPREGRRAGRRHLARRPPAATARSTERARRRCATATSTSDELGLLEDLGDVMGVGNLFGGGKKKGKKKGGGGRATSTSTSTCSPARPR